MCCTSEMQRVDEDDARVGVESAGGEELRHHFVRAITYQLVDCPTSCLDVFEVHCARLSQIVLQTASELRAHLKTSRQENKY